MELNATSYRSVRATRVRTAGRRGARRRAARVRDAAARTGACVCMRDDAAAAFAFASPDIRQQFATPEHFMAMVRKSFRPVYRPRSYSFGAPALLDGVPVQPVRVIGPNGHGTVALYQMERQPDGSWRIAGVTLHPIGERSI